MKAPPSQSHSPTSIAAAEQIAAHAGSQRATVLAAIRTFGPLSDERIGELTGLCGDSVRPRRVSLLADGLIEQRGEGRTAKGRRCALWAACAVQETLGP